MKNEYSVTLKVESSRVMEALEEAAREAGARRGIYKRWVEAGKMTQSLAWERQKRMDDAAMILKQCINTMSTSYQPSLDFSVKEEA